MNDTSMIEKKEPQEQKLSSTANAYLESADATTLSRLKNLVSEKARRILGLLVKKVALTGGGLYLLISFGCGNIENPLNSPTSIPEPTPVSTPTPLPTESTEIPTLTPIVPVSEPTPTPTRTNPPTHIPKSTKTPPPTPEPTQFPTITPRTTPDSTSTRVPEPTPLLHPAESPIPTETPDVEKYDYHTILGVQVAFDLKDGLPAMYVLPSGKKVFLDKEIVRQLKDKAIANEEPEIIEVIIADWNVSDIEGQSGPDLEKVKYSSEHPKTVELPDDIVSEEELKTRGIKIVQADNTHLYIRRGAFEEGEPLSDFTKNGNSSIEIVLINAPGIADYYIKDPRYLSGRGNKESLEKDRQEILGKWEEGLSSEYLDNLKKYRKDSKGSPYEDEIEAQMEGLMIWPKGVIAALTTMPFDLLADYIVGLKYPLGSYYIDSDSVTITLAVGEKKVKELLFLYINHQGQFRLTRSSDYIPSDYSRTSKEIDTYPNPAGFTKLNYLPDEYSQRLIYPYIARTVGFNARHELSHDQLIRQRKNKGQTVNNSEWDTDMNAMEGIARAWKKWVDSGYTNNSGYYFVFSLPEGGYILTENKPPSDSTVSLKS